MEQAFILPLPKYTAPLEDEADLGNQISFWRGALDKLRDRKMSWEQFCAYLPQGLEALPSHPAARLASNRNGQTLLHIAVLHDRKEVIDLLSRDPQLRLRRNHFGLTPLELAQFLHQSTSLTALGSSKPLRFAEQSNVLIEGDLVAEKLQNLVYLPSPIFEHEKLLDEVLDRTRKAKLEDAIPPEKIWMGIYFDQEIQSGPLPRISIRRVDDEVGFGIFAEQRIPSCAFVGEYTGVIQERRKRHLKDKTYCVRYTTWQMGQRKFVIDAEEKGNYTRFINHSSNPNLGLQSVYWRGLPRMVFISLKEIPEGTQLTFDYGHFFWKEIRQTPKNLS